MLKRENNLKNKPNLFSSKSTFDFNSKSRAKRLNTRPDDDLNNTDPFSERYDNEYVHFNFKFCIGHLITAKSDENFLKSLLLSSITRGWEINATTIPDDVKNWLLMKEQNFVPRGLLQVPTLTHADFMTAKALDVIIGYFVNDCAYNFVKFKETARYFLKSFPVSQNVRLFPIK